MRDRNQEIDNAIAALNDRTARHIRDHQRFWRTTDWGAEVWRSTPSHLFQYEQTLSELRASRTAYANLR